MHETLVKALYKHKMKVKNNTLERFNGLEQCFSIQVAMNKCFLLKPEKNLARILPVIFEKNAKTAYTFSTYHRWYTEFFHIFLFFKNSKTKH